jgi:hypothetical protein
LQRETRPAGNFGLDGRLRRGHLTYFVIAVRKIADIGPAF